MTAPTYRRKPTTVTAMQWDGSEESAAQILAWMDAAGAPGLYTPPLPYTNDGATRLETSATLTVETLRGPVSADPDDYILQGDGEFYPCPPEVFAATYTDAAPAFGDAFEDLARILARRVGEHDGAAEWNGDPIVYNGGNVLLDEAIESVQRRWEERSQEQEAQVESMRWALDDDEVRAWLDASRPAPDRDALAEALAAALTAGEALLCTRVWEAWRHGTMSDDDFTDAGAEPEFVADLVDAVLAAGARTAPAVGHAGCEAAAEESRRVLLQAVRDVGEIDPGDPDQGRPAELWIPVAALDALETAEPVDWVRYTATEFAELIAQAELQPVPLRECTDEAQRDRLPVGTIVQDPDGAAWERHTAAPVGWARAGHASLSWPACPVLVLHQMPAPTLAPIRVGQVWRRHLGGQLVEVTRVGAQLVDGDAQLVTWRATNGAGRGASEAANLRARFELVEDQA